MLRSLTAKQFYEWWCYAELDPFGERRQDYRVASILQMLYNIHRSSKQPAASIEDMLLPFGEQEERPAPPPKQSWQQQLAIARMMVEVTNAAADTNQQIRDL